MSINQLAQLKKDVVSSVADKVKEYQNKKELYIPKDYSPENAMTAAWLQLQEVRDANKNLALESCTRDSIANSLFSMVVQGLDPNKKQCYFIAYGKQLVLQRSYFGTIAVAKRVDENIEDVYADVVYEGDEFEYEKFRGVTTIISHKQKLVNVKKENIIAGYCTIVYKDNKEVTTIMTMDQIKQAWQQSKNKPIGEDGVIKASSTHGKFTEEMCKKTVINRGCKGIINSSSDRNLLLKVARETETNIIQAEVVEEIENNANTEIIDTPTIEDEEDNNIENLSETIEQQPTIEETPY